MEGGKEGRNVRGERGLRTLVRGQHDVGRLLEVLGEQVAQGVVFLEHEEVGRVGHAWYREGLVFCWPQDIGQWYTDQTRPSR